jgi:hypothetical protein
LNSLNQWLKYNNQLWFNSNLKCRDQLQPKLLLLLNLLSNLVSKWTIKWWSSHKMKLWLEDDSNSMPLRPHLMQCPEVREEEVKWLVESGIKCNNNKLVLNKWCHKFKPHQCNNSDKTNSICLHPLIQDLLLLHLLNTKWMIIINLIQTSNSFTLPIKHLWAPLHHKTTSHKMLIRTLLKNKRLQQWIIKKLMTRRSSNKSI